MNDRDQLGPSPYQRAMKRAAALEAEIERLKFMAKEEQETIEDLSKLLIRAADALEAIYHEWPILGPPDPLIVELRKAAE